MARPVLRPLNVGDTPLIEAGIIALSTDLGILRFLSPALNKRPKAVLDLLTDFDDDDDHSRLWGRSMRVWMKTRHRRRDIFDRNPGQDSAVDFSSAVLDDYHSSRALCSRDHSMFVF